MHRIMIVEDDGVIAEQMHRHLTQWGYQVHVTENFRDILPEFTKFNPHLILLDISLPYFNGYHWCLEFRKRSNLPIIFVSSASDNMNIVMAVNMGGDDFIAKPFDSNVLTAKIQAMLRRSYDFQSEISLLERGDVMLDLSAAALLYQDKNIPLTKNEFQITRLLMENAGHVVARDDIMASLWEDENFIDDNTLTVNITRLRKKLEENGLFDFIVTKKGMGYIVL